MHLLTFDIEHWYEGYRYRGIDGWQDCQPHDGQLVEYLLDMLGEMGQSATMFFTGRYAEEFPQVVQRAAREGHEIASHSYTHKVLSQVIDIDEFRKDLKKSLTILQDLTGCKVKGYRAPRWFIPSMNYHDVLLCLVESGLEYDSSVFPKLFSHLESIVPHKVKLEGGVSIWEIPATTYSLLGLNLPVAGGAYFRIFPQWITRMALSSQTSNAHPVMIYLHPYDLDTHSPKLPCGNFFFKAWRYYGLNTVLDYLTEILKEYKFTTVIDWVRQNDSGD